MGISISILKVKLEFNEKQNQLLIYKFHGKQKIIEKPLEKKAQPLKQDQYLNKETWLTALVEKNDNHENDERRNLNYNRHGRIYRVNEKPNC